MFSAIEIFYLNFKFRDPQKTNIKKIFYAENMLKMIKNF